MIIYCLFGISVPKQADMAELADALDLGSSGRPCRFKSCYPHTWSPYFMGSVLFCVRALLL